MRLGLNQNIPFKGDTYHIQTEDGGVKNPTITTIVFKGGTILATQKTSYADIIKFDKLDDVVQELMDEQHGKLLKLIKQGYFEKGPRPINSKKATPKKPDRAAAKTTDTPPDKEKPLDDLIMELLSLDGDK